MAETASRAEARAPSDGGPLSALRIAPADDDKFFPVEAFRLEPGAPVGLVTAVDPFRDDAFKPVLAAHPMEGRALADLMIVIPKRSRHTGKECSQPPFAIDQRQNAQIFAVKKQQVEQEDGQGSARMRKSVVRLPIRSSINSAWRVSVRTSLWSHRRHPTEGSPRPGTMQSNM